MKKFFPLGLALLCIAIFIGIISRNEAHLKNSESIFIKLQPVDPRSLIQGDYMVLNYELFWQDNQPDNNKPILNQHHVLASIQLDGQKRVIATRLDDHLPQKLILKNPTNRVDRLYPAANSFLFAEGLAKCYDQAEYAEFKVNKDGKSILASLRGENLEDLNCEQKKSWFKF